MHKKYGEGYEINENRTNAGTQPNQSRNENENERPLIDNEALKRIEERLIDKIDAKMHAIQEIMNYKPIPNLENLEKKLEVLTNSKKDEAERTSAYIKILDERTKNILREHEKERAELEFLNTISNDLKERENELVNMKDEIDKLISIKFEGVKKNVEQNQVDLRQGFESQKNSISALQNKVKEYSKLEHEVFALKLRTLLMGIIIFVLSAVVIVDTVVILPNITGSDLFQKIKRTDIKTVDFISQKIEDTTKKLGEEKTEKTDKNIEENKTVETGKVDIKENKKDK